MAKIYTYEGDSGVFCVQEDPRPGNDSFWLYGNKVNRETLTPEFNNKFNWNTGPLAWTNYQSNAVDTYPRYGRLNLTKTTISQGLYYEHDGSDIYNMDDGFWIDMSPNLKTGHAKNWTYGDESTVDFEYHNGYTGGFYTTDVKMEVEDDLGNGNMYTTSDTYVAGGSRWHQLTGESNNRLFGLRGYSQSNSAHYKPRFYWQHRSWPYGGAITDSTTSLPNRNGVQYLGKSDLTGQPMCVLTEVGSAAVDCYVKVLHLQYTTTTPTVTQLASFTSGYDGSTSTTTSGGSAYSTYVYRACSSTFVDPRDSTGNKTCFYAPYIDPSKNYHPMLFTWDRTTDTFTRTDNVEITGDLSSVHNDMTGYQTTGNQYTAGTKAITINETFESGGNRYVMIWHMHHRYTKYDNYPGMRTVVVYQVDTTSLTDLTYHSSFTVASTIRNVIWLNDERTILGVFTGTAFYIYAFNTGSGWELTTTIPKPVLEIGRDSSDRIWYITQSIRGTSYPDLHMLTPSLPVTLDIQTEDISLVYSGTDIATYVEVKALNATGTLIATDVKLVIESSSMTFSDDTKIKTVTTLTTGPLSVPTKLIAAGFTNISASINI